MHRGDRTQSCGERSVGRRKRFFLSNALTDIFSLFVSFPLFLSTPNQQQPQRRELALATARSGGRRAGPGGTATIAAATTAAGAGTASHARGAPAKSSLPSSSPLLLEDRESAGVLHYSTRPPQPGKRPVPPLSGPRLGSEADAAAGTPKRDFEPRDDSLLGQLDSVAGAGDVRGWACVRGDPSAAPLPVFLYVDGVRVGEVLAGEETPHEIVHRLCGRDADAAAKKKLGGPIGGASGASDSGSSSLSSASSASSSSSNSNNNNIIGVGFSFTLPPLPQGRHELRAFLGDPHRCGKQELSQSPLPFVESAAQPAAAAALARKDAIIRVRNAQVSALWDELHTRQPWRNALGGDGPPISLTFDDNSTSSSSTPNKKRLVAVLGINTGISARARRDDLRRTWVPNTREGLQAYERDLGVIIRFVVGYSDQKDDPDEIRLRAEAEEFGDVVRIDMIDTYADLSMKTLKMFSVLPDMWDASFYFKIDDDVAVNVPALADYLAQRAGQGNLYLGCMKSGQVLTDRRYKWFEPEHWRFGDAATAEGAINYPRHASGQVYGLAAPVARYIGRSAPVLHRFANEDVTLGAWLLGLNVKHVDERRLCCDSAERCGAQTAPSNVCLSYYEHQCAGICSPEKRLVPIFKSCLDDPLAKRPADLGAGVTDWDEGLGLGAGGAADDDDEEGGGGGGDDEDDGDGGKKKKK